MSAKQCNERGFHRFQYTGTHARKCEDCGRWEHLLESRYTGNKYWSVHWDDFGFDDRMYMTFVNSKGDIEGV